MKHEHSHTHPHPRKNHGGHHHPHLHNHWSDKDNLRPSGRSGAHHHFMRRGRPTCTSAATPRIRKVWDEVYGWWADMGSLGIYNRRKIAGSSSWSQHAWGDAWDMTDAKTVKNNAYSTQMKAAVAFLNKSVVNAKLAITRVIAGDSAHKNHAHIDCDPDRTGTPP